MFSVFYKNKTFFNVLIGVITLVFILGTAIMWGPGAFNFLKGNYIVKIGDIIVTPKEYLILLANLKQKYKNLPEEQLKELAKQELMIIALGAYLAKKNGFYVSEEEILNLIRTSFVNSKGEFDEKLLKSYLTHLNISFKEFEEMIRKQLLWQKYKLAVLHLSYANKETVEALILPTEYNATVEIYEITPDILGIKPTKEEIEKFYQAHKKELVKTLPARVVIYKLNSKEDVKKLYELIKRKEKVNYPIVGVFNETSSAGNYTELVERAFRSQSMAIKKLSSNQFLVAVYIEPRTVELSLEEAKEQIEKLLKKEKFMSIALKNAKEIKKAILEGKYKNLLHPKLETDTLFSIMKKYKLSFPQILSIIEGKEKIIDILADGRLYILHIIKLQKIQEINENKKLLFQQIAKAEDYNAKLQEILQYYLRKLNEIISIK